MRKSWIIALVALMVATAGMADVKGQDVSNTGEVHSRATGGPDGFGYSYIDSNEVSPYAPSYLWIDACASGTSLGLSDDGTASIPIGFTFDFYGNPYTSALVDNNGNLSMGADPGGFSNDCPMPSTSENDPMLYPFWDDLNNQTGDVCWEYHAVCPQPDGIGTGTGECVVIEWFDRPHYQQIGSTTFEAILYEGGDIVYQYADVDFGDPAYDGGASATVGIEDDLAGAGYFLEYSCNAANIAADLAILFTTGDVPVELQSMSIE